MRNKGTFNFSGNLEVKKDAPLEARSLVNSYADLTKPETWTDEEGGVWTYSFMNVTCKDRPGKIYQLIGEDYTEESNWKEIGSSSGGGIEDAPADNKIYGRKNKDWVKVPENSNVIILPKEILDLTGSSSSEEILAAFGGIDKYKDLLEKLSTNNCLVQIGEPSLGSLRHIYTLVEYAVNFASNKQSGALSLNIYNEEQQLRRLHFYLENNGTTARCGEASTFQLVRDTDVLTKTNTSSFTPTQPYHPATKKYVDDKTFVRDVDGTILNKWINNTVITGETVQGLVNELFGNFISFAENYAEGRYRGLRFSTRHYDEESGNYFGYIINANIQYCLSEPGNGYFELLFTFGYGSTLKSCYIYYYDVSETSNENKIVITDVIRSDNLTTITKKTAAEYEAIGSKDANTAYCVTD